MLDGYDLKEKNKEKITNRFLFIKPMAESGTLNVEHRRLYLWIKILHFGVVVLLLQP